MSERRKGFFALVPAGFMHAWQDGLVGPVHANLMLVLAWRCFEARNTGGGIARVNTRELGDRCGVNDETARKKLHDLRALGFIDFEPPRPGPGCLWGIWMPEGELRPTHRRVTSPVGPPGRQLIASGNPLPELASPHGKSAASVSELPPFAWADEERTRRDETRATTACNGVKEATAPSPARAYDHEANNKLAARLAHEAAKWQRLALDSEQHEQAAAAIAAGVDALVAVHDAGEPAA